MTKERAEKLVGLLSELITELAREQVNQHEGDYETPGNEKGIKAQLVEVLTDE